MSKTRFTTLVYAQPKPSKLGLAIAATRYGAVGVVNAELDTDAANIFACLDAMEAENGAKGAYGLKLASVDAALLGQLQLYFQKNLRWLILNADTAEIYFSLIKPKKSTELKVLVECINGDIPPFLAKADGVIVKGNESGGYVGEESSFILLQKWAKQTNLPLYVHGGLTPHVAAACAAMGVAGGVFDSQVLLLEESAASPALQKLLASLSGSETVAVGDGEKGRYFRVLSRPQLKVARQFISSGEGLSIDTIRELVADIGINWQEPAAGLLPVGHDVCFAENYRKQYGTVVNLLKALDKAVESYAQITTKNPPIIENSPLAQDLGIPLPIIQGPMTRVSDTAQFAGSVAAGGALPMLAFALSKGEQITKLLAQTKSLLGAKPWGIGLLGFVPPALLEEQIQAALPFAPNYAIIAGGRPDQAVALEAQGIPSFLHLPSANLLANFLKNGARRFIFEGRECGGHIGPLSSFVLWSTMIDRLLVGLDDCAVAGPDVQCIFAGGIHDAYSSALLQVMVAPLIAKGVKIGVIMGSAYLFTKEIVESGAIVEQFQRVVVDCEHTVNLESGPGHASRCAYTPFAANFFEKRKEYKNTELPADEVRSKLDDLILGTLRIASKGVMRKGERGEMVAVNNNDQQQAGMYMLGQVVPLRRDIITIAALHNEVTEGAKKLLESRIKKAAKASHEDKKAHPADIAIVGMSCALPGAKDAKEFWQNILAKKDTITEVPKERWDWRLYFDADRHARDKVYSKWGGFLADMLFDPMKYGITPKSIESVDPMQLMALEVAHAALSDAGFDFADSEQRMKTSVIVGASGGAGDVGMQYGLRSELPRFTGELPAHIADALPEWTEDTFAGILINVVAGRIANRLNLGGVNYTTDAACASSLTAVYQAVAELRSGTSDVVIAGGADTVQGPFGYMCFSQTQALSPTGRCRTFDETSDGIVISEGIVMLVLKRLSDAQRDGDKIYSVIKGIGGGSDGKAKGLSAPLPEGQLRAMRRAYEQAGFAPDSVGLFEAHGTGTVAGDTAELESTSALIRQSGGLPRQAVVGSVKTLIGHTKATAGIAGLMKAALSLHHKILPPHGFVDRPNKVLADADASLYLLEKPAPWLHSKAHPRRAAASAFGFGGTNFHVVLEEYCGEYRASHRPAPSELWPVELFVWSGADKQALAASLARVQQLDKSGFELRDVAFSCANSYADAGERCAIVAADFGQLAQRIDAVLAYLQNGSALPEGCYYGQSAAGKLAVLFPGQGSQYTGMLDEIAAQFGACADVLSAADAQLATAFEQRFGAGKSLSSFIFPRGAYDAAAKKAAEEALKNTDVAQAALGAVEAGLWQLMCGFGLQTDMMAGHSYGEFVALYAAGCLDFADLMVVSEARGRLIVDKAKNAGLELGTMAAVKASRAEVEAVIADVPGVVIANHNAPQQIIISGAKAAVEQASAALGAAGKTVVKIPVAAAFHSPQVEPAREALAEVIGGLNWQSGDVAVYSNNTAKPHSQNLAKLKKAMADHLVGPVEFVAQIEAMYADGARVFLEVGSKNVLTRLVGQILGDRPHMAVALDDKGRGLSGMLTALAQLLCAGVALDVRPLFIGRGCLENSRAQSLPKHGWWLNGSVARRMSEGVKQVGVTAETVRIGHTETSSRAERGHTDIVRINSNTRRQLPMKQRENEGDNTITRAYFELVASQLDNARDVALAELGVSLDSALQRPAAAVRQRGSSPLPQAAAMPVRQTAPVALPIKTAAAPNLSVVAPIAKQTEVKPAAAALDKDAIRVVILSIVTEKTGYEADMIEFTQNLEADLGVDSIKRVDIVGSILEALPKSVAQGLGEQGKSQLSTATTLEKMLNILTEAGATPANFNMAGVGSNMVSEIAHHLPRLEASRFGVTAVAEPAVTAAKKLTPGDFVLTCDTEGVAEAMAVRLLAEGCRVHVVPDEALQNEAALLKWCDAQILKSLAGIVHLAALDSEAVTAESTTEDWRKAIFKNEKSLFLLAKYFSGALQDTAHILTASNLGGVFGRDGKQTTLTLQGGAVGMVKSLCKERATLRGKAVDLDAAQSAEAQVAQLWDELMLEGGRVEVGYPAGVRTIFKTIAATIENAPALTQTGLVILATGGARGVTAEVLRELAIPGNTFVLTGRSALPTEAQTLRGNPALAAFETEKDLARYFVKEESLSLGDARKKAGAVLAAREMLDNIADFEAAGAAVEYCAVDVVDEAAMAAMLADLYKKYGKIDGVVHGAGIIEDKFLPEISSESWSRVVETKVIGLLLLQKYIQAESLQFLTIFSSVSGRYGNAGQANYATANELMSRICCQLQGRLQNVKISSLCWGPWSRTKFGAGMVNPAIEKSFADQGVHLVSAALGRELFRQQFVAGDGVEIVCGEAPWEAHEAASGAIRKTAAGPLANVAVEHFPKGEIRLSFQLNLGDAYLQDHIIDELPVLPMAFTTEMMAQAVAHVWGKEWQVTEVSQVQSFTGIIVDKDTYPLVISMVTTSHGMDGTNAVKVRMMSEGEKPVPHYGATVHLASELQPFDSEKVAVNWPATRTLTVEEAYGRSLFHGQSFQVIGSIENLSEQGVRSVVRTSSQEIFLDNASDTAWLFDPAIVDAAAQMSWLWMDVFHDAFALPVKFGRIVRLVDALPQEVVMEYVIQQGTQQSVTANVYFSDQAGQLLFWIEGMQHVASSARKARNKLAA